MTNEEVTTRAGVDNLHLPSLRHDDVAGHILRTSRVRIAHVAMEWVSGGK